MPPETRSKPQISPSRDDEGLQASAPPLMVTVSGVAADLRNAVAPLARRAGCRLYEVREGPADSVILVGLPEHFTSLRNLLLPITDLQRVRETIEAALGDLAAPEGLPQLTSDLYRKTEVAEEMPVVPGTTLLVSREFVFDAAHNLPRYNGKCERLHGHTFKVKVTVKAPLDNWSGMAFDFHDLKTVVNRRVVDVLDHSYVNETVPNPSAEFIAIWCWDQLSDLPLHEIKVWETPNCCVTYNGPPATGNA